MFIGREWELNILNERYASGRFEFMVIYGRRRVGKTALIEHFIRGKKAIYFTGVEGTVKSNLENFSSRIMEYGEKSQVDATFASFQAALERVFHLAEKERLVLVIDEYPFVGRADRSFASVLQFLIDKNKDKSRLFLILCGSSMSYMADNVLAYKSPLYGRRTGQLKVEPFNFEESCLLLKNFSGEDKALLYGAFGGTPQYLLQINGNFSAADNIKKNFFDRASFIYEEPVNLLKQEVREPALYYEIIRAIAAGHSRMADIANKVGEKTGVCSVYLKNLMTLGLVKKETPYGKKESRRSVYEISDNMLRFWYRFVPENSSLAAINAAGEAYARIEPYLNDYMGRIFEEISAQYLWKLLLCGKSPVRFAGLGRWWGSNPDTKEQEEIDIMGQEDRKTALFAECKWTNARVDRGVLIKLADRSRMFPYTKVHFYLFAKRGFTRGCIDAARDMGNVTLVTYGDILASFGKKAAVKGGK